MKVGFFPGKTLLAILLLNSPFGLRHMSQGKSQTCEFGPFSMLGVLAIDSPLLGLFGLAAYFAVCQAKRTKRRIGKIS